MRNSTEILSAVLTGDTPTDAELTALRVRLADGTAEAADVAILALAALQGTYVLGQAIEHLGRLYAVQHPGTEDLTMEKLEKWEAQSKEQQSTSEFSSSLEGLDLDDPTHKS